ncbi:hypothetical protein ACU4GG_01480 [Streptomyces nojiriensis]
MAVALLVSGEEGPGLLEAVRERVAAYVERGLGERAAFAADADAAPRGQGGEVVVEGGAGERDEGVVLQVPGRGGVERGEQLGGFRREVGPPVRGAVVAGELPCGVPEEGEAGAAASGVEAGGGQGVLW